ncbi:unnamed protein product [Amoebophrya sp. A120]|nr:unnamed protein product [Amoebophrya sp. A120]|eukprot:GSA120T00022198001.1
MADGAGNKMAATGMSDATLTASATGTSSSHGLTGAELPSKANMVADANLGLTDKEINAKKMEKEKFLKDAMFIDERGMTVLPDAREILRQRHFTLEGFTLEEQVDEIRRIRRRGKNEIQRSQNLNLAFRRNVEEVGILRHAAVKFGVLPADFERELELSQMAKGGMFEMQDPKALATSALNVDAPEWIKALLELSGLTGIRDYIREDRMRRKESDYVHQFPDVFRLVSSLDFELGGSLLILVNAGFLSWQISQFDRYANADMFDALEKFFTLLFFGEWTLRIVAYGFTSIFEPFNGFDTFLVVGCGFLPQFVLPLLGVELDPSGMRTFTALRTIRVIRVAKAVRMRPEFKEMWELVNGFASSILVTSWTLIILIIFVYCFGVLAVKLLQQEGFEQPHHDVDYKQVLYGDVMDGMLSMFQVVTLDAFSDGIVRKLTFQELAKRFLPEGGNVFLYEYDLRGYTSSLDFTTTTTTTMAPVILPPNVTSTTLSPTQIQAAILEGTMTASPPAGGGGAGNMYGIDMTNMLSIDGELLVRLRPNGGDSDWQIFYMRLFFALFVVIANMVVLNTIMAMVVQKTFQLSKQDEEVMARQMQEQKERELMILTEMFLDIDVDRSGDLTRREFYAALDYNEYIRDRLSDLDMAPEYLKETWGILDDGDGKLTVFEFTSGIRSLKGDARTKDVMDAQKRLEACKSFVDEVLEPKVIKLDRIFHILANDMREIRDDVELVSLSTANLAKMVRSFYEAARVRAAERKVYEEKAEREKKLRELEDRKAAEVKAKASANVMKEKAEHLDGFDPRRKKG